MSLPASDFPPKTGVVSVLTSLDVLSIKTVSLTTLVLAPVPPWDSYSTAFSSNNWNPLSRTTTNCCKPPKTFIVTPCAELVNVILEPLLTF